MLIEMGLKGVETSLGQLDHVMDNAGFVRCATWDYEHATYDFKYEEKGTVYYLRVQGHVVDGEGLDHDTVLKLEEPHIGKHLFPHGIDYDAAIPSGITDSAKKKLSEVKQKLS